MVLIKLSEEQYNTLILFLGVCISRADHRDKETIFNLTNHIATTKLVKEEAKEGGNRTNNNVEGS